MRRFQWDSYHLECHHLLVRKTYFSNGPGTTTNISAAALQHSGNGEAAKPTDPQLGARSLRTAVQRGF
jgi:hypothetical protein